MKHVDEYRQPYRCRALVSQICAAASRPWTIMEVCGGQTHGLLRYGIDLELRGVIELLHGPGCPVCVTPVEAIDFAIELAQREDVIVASFGDMLRVPGSHKSLLSARSEGGRVQIVYSPMDAVQLAARHPELSIVFFAVGFETTAPATALAVQQANRYGLDNFSLLVSHVRVQPAMEMLIECSDCSVDGFLAAGHVCTVAGFDSYHEFVQEHRLPVVVTGFEPVDLLTGILECVRQLERGEVSVANCYQRSVAAAGNPCAMGIINDVYEICDRPWRGFGLVPRGGFRLREKWRRFDAQRRFNANALPIIEASDCRSGDVLAGRIKPTECAAFGTRCTPDSPLGAPMVSAEGVCAAYFQYVTHQPTSTAIENYHA
jgi:hydrogenase expression/formation protein HypD